MKKLICTFVFGAALAAITQVSFAKEEGKGGSTDAAFMKKAAIGGMTEVELGKIAAEKGTNQDVKDFGNRMVADHGKANDELKSIASKLNATVPDKPDSKHQGDIDKFSKMSSGDAFDKAYARNMVQDHEEDVAEFQKAEKQVKDADLKKFIQDTVPIMKEHLEMAKKLSGGGKK